MLNGDFSNQISQEEKVMIARALWEHYIEHRQCGEMESTKGLMKESGEVYIRFLKSMEDTTIVRFGSVFEDDHLQNADVYYVCFQITSHIAIVVHDVHGNEEYYLHNNHNVELNEFMLANY